MEAKFKQHYAGENEQPRKKYKDVADWLYNLVNDFDKNNFDDNDFDNNVDNVGNDDVLLTYL